MPIRCLSIPVQEKETVKCPGTNLSNLKKFVDDETVFIVIYQFLDAASGPTAIQIPSKEIVPFGKFSAYRNQMSYHQVLVIFVSLNTLIYFFSITSGIRSIIEGYLFFSAHFTQKCLQNKFKEN